MVTVKSMNDCIVALVSELKVLENLPKQRTAIYEDHDLDDDEQADKLAKLAKQEALIEQNLGDRISAIAESVGECLVRITEAVETIAANS